MHPHSLRVYMSRSIRSELTVRSLDTVKLPIKSRHSCCMRRRSSFIYLWTSLASLFIRRISPQHFITLSVHCRSSCPSEPEKNVLFPTHKNIFDLDTRGVGEVRSLEFYDICLCILVIIYLGGIVVIRYCAEV